MIVSGRNYNSIWYDQIIDFKYAVNRMNIIYPYSLEPKDWNDPFNLNLNDFVQLISDLKFNIKGRIKTLTCLLIP